MKKILVFVMVVAAIVFVFSQAARAELLPVPQVIDFEGFDPSLDGVYFDYHSYEAVGMWRHEGASFTLALPADWLQADFSVILGGAGYVYQPRVFLNDFLLGYASIGDGMYLEDNAYQVDTWPLSASVLASLSSQNTLRIDSYSGDGWVFKGARVSGIRLVDNGATAPVPEPATCLLFGTGLAGLAAVGRKRRR